MSAARLPSDPERIGWDQALRHEDALALFARGMAPSEADEALGLVLGTTHDAVCGAWAHGINPDRFAKEDR